MLFKKKKNNNLSKEQIDNLESLGIKYVSKKGKPDIITGRSDSADIIIQTKTKKFKNLFLVIPMLIILIPSVLVFIFLNINNIVTEDVIGSSYSISRVSIVPKSYRINTKELSVGDIILYKEKKNEKEYKRTGIGSFIYKYETATISRIVDDWWVYISVDGVKDRIKISTDRILYVKDVWKE